MNDNLQIPRRLRVFFCHSSSDKQIVRDLYRKLLVDGIDQYGLTRKPYYRDRTGIRKSRGLFVTLML